MIAPTNLILTRLLSGIRLNWTCAGAHETEIYVSVDGSAYALLDTVAEGIVTYDDINDYLTHTVKYRLRAKGAVTTSGFSNAVNDILEFVFTSTGDGSGLGVFNLEVSENTVATIDGAGKFYTDLAGTEGESDTWNLTTTGSGFKDNLNRIYIKVPSGTATLRIKNVVTKWGEALTGGSVLDDGWDTYCYDALSTNCPRVSIDVATMTRNTSINVFGLNRLTGDLSGNSIMTYMEIADGTPNHMIPGHGGATCGGDMSNMPLVTFDCWDDTHFTGTCESANMEVIWCNGYNEVTFNISAMPSLRTLNILDSGNCKALGDISLCPNIKFVQVFIPTDLTGSIAGCVDLYYFFIAAGSVTAPNVTNLTDLSYLDMRHIALTSDNVNQILADIWVNRDEPKTFSFRRIYLSRVGSGAPTGQGLTDLANLRAYRSPNNDPTKYLWTVDVTT